MEKTKKVLSALALVILITGIGFISACYWGLGIRYLYYGGGCLLAGFSLGTAILTVYPASAKDKYWSPPPSFGEAED